MGQMYEVLYELADTNTRIIELRNRQTYLVKLLRSHGITWEDIGRAVGISKQAAQQKWSQE